MKGKKLLAGVAESASYNIVVMIMFRIQTFMLNGFILHYISNEVLGIINVRIMLLYFTIMFVGTEAFKQASMADPTRHHWPQVINMLWLTLPTTALWSFTLGYIWLNVLEQPSVEWSSQYTLAIWVVGITSIIDRLGEALFTVSGVFLFNKFRAIVISVCIGLNSSILACSVYYSPQHAIYGYCVAQVVQSVTGVLILYGFFAYYLHYYSLEPFRTLRDFFPRWLKDRPNVSPELMQLTFSFFKQGILKQVLTEGERYMMTVFNILNFAEQGIYDIVSNLGSMAARLIFMPIEQSGYQYFAQQLERNVPIPKQSEESVELAANVLKNLLKMMTLIGLIVVTFGYSYSYLLLQLYGGETLTSGIGPNLLRWQCFYVLALAVNGITECFTFATMTKNDIDRYNFIMVFISAAFLLLAWYLTHLFGSVGFILANCANMSLRILHSILYIKRSFRYTPYTPLGGIIPHPSVLVMLVSSYGITASSETMFCCDKGLTSVFYHIAIGATCLAAVLGTILIVERDLIQFVQELWSPKKDSSSDEDTDKKED